MIDFGKLSDMFTERVERDIKRARDVSALEFTRRTDIKDPQLGFYGHQVLEFGG
jgi:hypothetical protein